MGSIAGKRVKHSQEGAGVMSGLSEQRKVEGDGKKLREGGDDGMLPKHEKDTAKTKAGSFKVC